MAVTVKTVKKKPLSLKKPGAEPGSPGAEGADGQPAEGAAPAAAAPVAGAKAPSSEAPVKKASYTFAGICAILVFLMFAAILTLQILEWKFFHGPPKNAFPPFGIGPEKIPIPGGSSIPTSVPVVEAPVADEGGSVEEDGGVPVDEGVPVE